MDGVFMCLIFVIFIETAAIVALAYLVYKYASYTNQRAELTFEECISILQLIINSELQSYEKDIFISKGSITNSNFENYYRDITGKIVNNLSDDLIDSFTYYITEDAIYTYIARAVKVFLTGKINGTV